jgi:hypothetical protein
MQIQMNENEIPFDPAQSSISGECCLAEDGSRLGARLELETDRMSHGRMSTWGLQTASGNGDSSGIARANSDGEGDVPVLDDGDAAGLDELGMSGDEVPPFCTSDDPLDEDEKGESLETLRRRKVDADRRRISFKNFMTIGCREPVIFTERENART